MQWKAFKYKELYSAKKVKHVLVETSTDDSTNNEERIVIAD